MTISLRSRFFIGAILLLVLSLGFNALLSLHSLEKLYIDSIATQYGTIGKDFQRKVESALRFGKNIEKFFGIDKMLGETKQNIQKKISFQSTSEHKTPLPEKVEYVSVSVMLPDGRIHNSTHHNLVATTIPEHIKRQLVKKAPGSDQADTQLNQTRYLDSYIVSLPLRDRNNNIAAFAVIMFSANRVDAFSDSILQRCVKEIAIITVCSILLLLLLLSLGRANAPNVKRWKMKVTIAILFSILSAQLVFSGLNINAFHSHHLQINRQKALLLSHLLKNDIESLLDKGIHMRKMAQLDVLMEKIIKASPEISGIAVLDGTRTPLYMATKAGVIESHHQSKERPATFTEAVWTEFDSQHTIRLKINGAQRAQDATIDASGNYFIYTAISKEVIHDTFFRISLDSATVIVISFLFLGEILILFFIYFDKETRRFDASSSISSGLIRPCAFLLLFGAHISISFLPLHMEALFEPFFGLPKDIAIGLPISTEMLFAGISVIIAGSWIDRRGWYQPLICGLILSGAGAIYSGLTTGPVQFIASRGVVGFGYGLALMSSQGYVIMNTDESGKGHGLALLFAGVYAGSICGSAVGAMLAERIGYRQVFLVGAVITLLTALYAIQSLRSATRRQDQPHTTQQSNRVVRENLLNFFLNRNTASLLLFSCLPSAIAIIGFLNYFSPIYLDKLGESQSNIGRIFMIYGLCLVYIAPFVGKYSDRAKNQKRFVVTSGILGSCAFFAFFFFEGILATALAVFVLGISASFGTARRSYVLQLKTSRKLGMGKTMGVFNSTYRIGQVLGPIIIGWFMLSMEKGQGLIYLGLAYMGASLLFLILTTKDD